VWKGLEVMDGLTWVIVAFAVASIAEVALRVKDVRSKDKIRAYELL